MKVDNRFGGCPKCGETDGYVNVGRVHWFVCDKHKTKWRIGENLFSCWHDETDEVWEENAKLLSGYREVEPAIDDTGQHEAADAAKGVAPCNVVPVTPDLDIPF